MNRVLLVSENSSILEQLRAALDREVVIEALDNGIGCDTIAQAVVDRDIDVVILDFDLGDLDAFSVLKSLQQDELKICAPIVMVTCNQMESQVAIALNNGADDCISLPCSKLLLQARVRHACRRATSKRLTQQQETSGRVIAFIGAKGGVGTTTVAVNSGVALVERQLPVTLVDLRGFFGTMAAQLGVHPNEHPHSIAELLTIPANEITPERVDSLLIHHSSGMKVLLGPQEGDGYHRITRDQAESLVASLRGHASYTIFDLPAWPTEAVETVLGKCDQVLLVLEREPASVHAAQVLLNTIISDGVIHGNISAVVVNRSLIASPIPIAYLQQNLSCPIIAMIPPAPDACAAAARSYEPLIMFRHDLDCAEALAALAEKLTTDHPPVLAF